MPQTQKHHIVPKTYLRRFSPDGHRLSAFDKFSGAVIPTNIVDVAQKRFFYNVDPALLQGTISPLVIEDYLGRWETFYGRVLDLAEQASELGVLPVGLREVLAFFIQLQTVRTPEFRDRMTEVFSAGEEAFHARASRDGYRGEMPDLSHLAAFTPEDAATWQGILLGDARVMNELAQPLLGLIWYFRRNETTELLYTSDNPVARIAHTEQPLVGSGGWTAEGMEVQFPINPRLVLILKERTHFARLADADGQTFVMDHDDVRLCNFQQVSKCLRHVYSADPSFQTAIAACAEFPELRQADRHRLDFVTGS